MSDLFLAVQHVAQHIERIYAADALNIAVQDGVAAGQSVPHVHAHLIPRKANDLPEDEIYRMMESDGADLARAYATPGSPTQRRAKNANAKPKAKPKPKPMFPPVGEDERIPRSELEMAEEARWLERHMLEVD